MNEYREVVQRFLKVSERLNRVSHDLALFNGDGNQADQFEPMFAAGLWDEHWLNTALGHRHQELVNRLDALAEDVALLAEDILLQHHVGKVERKLEGK